MIGTIRRQLINLDILLTDIEVLVERDYASSEHVRLLQQVQSVLTELEAAALVETVSSYHHAVINAGLDHALADKRIPTIYIRLISYVLQFWDASEKAKDILTRDFDDKADKRLELLQVKATKAKSQFKTVAKAMGAKDYKRFLKLLGLMHDDWL